MSLDPFGRLGLAAPAAAGRRRRRRWLARYRRQLLALTAAILVAVALRAVSGETSGADLTGADGAVVGAGSDGTSASLVGSKPPGPAPPGLPRPPTDRVLVAVVPAEAAVLRLVAPGDLVDLYSVSTWDVGAPQPARRLAQRALVVGFPPSEAGTATALPLQAAPTSAALALAVTGAEAERIASAQGQALTVAVLARP